MPDTVDFNGYRPYEGSVGDPIPDRTLCRLCIELPASKELQPTNGGDAQKLVVRFRVDDGNYAGRCFTQHLLIEPNRWNEHADLASRNKSMIRSIIDSAHGLLPDEDNDRAVSARTLTRYAELEGKSFHAEIGVRSKDGSSFNFIRRVITPNMAEYPNAF